ncbi:AAA family ATPase [Bacillus benzoevorans]|uniref:Putative ATP-binding protein involved in virulence n=1 Tax=Bacillus benzoevorans TaxID=1456 RepID=A0A7X0LXQ8_9BACI|nr:AAA family ATPase [Bacillus benzoevorans]MBB6446742.1 putative ATP-binding protein involved in virulence [Bacillus benzoevorans]
MIISSLYIENFKLFKEKRLNFNDRFTLIIGNNGTGKTSILEALTVGLGGFLAGLDGVQTRNILYDEIRKEWDKPGDATITKEPQIPVIIECEGSIANQHLTWRRTKNSIEGKTTRSNARELIHIAKNMQQAIVKDKDHSVILPVISYQSAGRLFSQKKNKWVDPFKREDMSRFIGYTDCLESESNIKLFVNWLRRMTTIQLQKRKKIGELDAVLSAVEEFMKGLVEENEEVSIEYDFEEEEVMIELGKQRIPLRMMSSGYRSVIGMVADISYRMAILNPQLKEDAIKETPGVIIIDELDLHLHPKWQWKIVKDLKRTFPKVQFIATTHAPIIISSCSDVEIINLHDEKDYIKSTKENNPYGWQIEDTLTDIMNTYSRSPEIQKEINELEELYSRKILGELTKEQLEELKNKRKKLLILLPEGDPAITLAKIDAIGKLAMEQVDD